jgi:threonine dehydrogenase-like Zn-dependent dehydrogenase|tara:strand:- start:231 stop:677 length:447 start_codon:yes stop_codon:yes gene_type:complete
MGNSYDERIINNPKGFEASMKHFQKFSKTIRGCTDVDLMYERNGKFLFLEGKQVPNNWTVLTMPWAQWFALKQLRNLDSKKVKVFIVGYTTDGTYTFFPIGLGVKDEKNINFTKGHTDSHDFADEAEMLAFVKSLAEKMERQHTRYRR